MRRPGERPRSKLTFVNVAKVVAGGIILVPLCFLLHHPFAVRLGFFAPHRIAELTPQHITSMIELPMPEGARLVGAHFQPAGLDRPF